MVRRERITQFIALLVIIGLAGSVQAQTETKSGYIEVGLYPYADFSANPVSGAPPLAVAFTDKSSGSTPRTYQWNFGDGGTSTAANPSHTYTATGIYTVTLTITNSYGSDSETKAEYIRVGVGPVADFMGTPQSGNLPLAVTFQDMSTGNPATWSWTFGDGGTSTERNPSHTYTKAGTYGVTLTVTNAFGKSTKTRASYITTGVPPVADFTSGARAGGIPLTVKFTDASTGRPTSWSWDFGDGGTSTAVSPAHTYTKAGTYTVTLTVRNAFGSDSEAKAGYVTAGAKPDAEFKADPRIGTAPLTVKFTDLSSGSPASWKWDFGDGATSTEQNPAHVYQQEGSYNVTLTVTNSYGTDTEKKTADVGGPGGYITVGRGPSADFSANPVSGAPPLAVAFTDRSSGATPLAYQWAFGDGGTSTAASPAHTYSAAGVYTVTLTVTNAFGTDTETKAEYIRVGAGPVADFMGTPQSGNLALAVTFQDMSTGNPATWSWTFGDGGTSTERNPSHTYTKAGTYGVTLTVTNAFGKSTKTRASYITTGMPPTADFTSGARVGGVPLTVKFTDASTGRPTSWSWDFGDGGTSTQQNPSHTFTKGGTFTVTLTATNAYGSDSETKAGYVTAGAKPDAEFTADRRVGTAPLTVKFTDLSSGSPSSWAWNFGDGTTSLEQNPTHVYQLEGSYDVTLTVTNSYGTDTEKKTGTIDTCVSGMSGYIIVGSAPQADFSADRVAGSPPLAVAFTDRSSGATPLTYQWAFGDGATSTSTNPSHTYSAAGVYAVTLTVTNAFGTDTETKAEFIRVGAGPVADFMGTPQSGNLPLAVSFQDMSTGNPATWRWDFGDGSISSERNPFHTYTRAGTYGVTLTVTNAFGRSTKTRASYITTGMPPNADFTSGARAGGVPLTVKFTDASKGGPTSWSWDFGDGSTSAAVSPAHTYTKAGTYTVTLTVSNAYGSDSETKAGFVTAGGKPDADFTADERRGVKPFTVKFTDLSTGNPTSWKWDFGDGTTSTEQNPTHVYQQEGSYDVTLTVSNSYGSDTEKKTGASPLVTPPVATPPGATVPGTPSATTPGTSSPEQTQMPGFEGILAISGLAVLVYLAKRH